MNCSSSRRNSLRSILVLTTALLLAGACLAQGTFVSFDGPNAGTQQYHGTFPVAIGPWGGVLLMTIGDNGVAGAYVRHPNGSYLQILPPPGGSSMSVAGFNASGQVAGAYWDSQNNEVGFIRNTDGTYVTLNPPGSNGTTVAGINEAGQVAGNAYIGGTLTPFFWEPAHPDTYVTLSVPGGTSPYAKAINDSGQIAGAYNDTKTNQAFGFLRNADGTVSTFKVASSLGYANLQVATLNNWGTIVSTVFDENGSSTDLYLRYSGGGSRERRDASAEAQPMDRNPR